MTLTETTTDDRPEADQTTADPHPLIHWICLICYPDPAHGDPAMCGWPVQKPMGCAYPRPEHECTVCRQMCYPHYNSHQEV